MPIYCSPQCCCYEYGKTTLSLLNSKDGTELDLLYPAGEQGKAGIPGQFSEAETEEQAGHNSGDGQLNNLSCHTKYESRIRLMKVCALLQTSMAALPTATKK